MSDLDYDAIDVQPDETDADRESPELARFAFGHAAASVLADGTIKVYDYTKRAAETYFVGDMSLESNAQLFETVFGQAPITDPSRLALSLQRPDWSLPAGIAVIMGPASVGKTPIIRWMIDEALQDSARSGELVRFGEPLAGYYTRESDAVRHIISALLNPNVKVIAIDSVKDLLSTIDGAAMARGIPRPFFRMLSNWGTFAATLGKTIVVPLNISTDDANAMAEVQSAVLSNADFVAIADVSRPEAEQYTFHVTARQGEGQRRSLDVLTLSFPQGKAKVRFGVGRTLAGAGEVVVGDSSTALITGPLLSAALSRVILNSDKD